MGNGIGSINFNGNYNYKDYENVAKYALGSTLVAHEETPFSGMGLFLGIGGVMEAFKGLSWLNKAYKNPISANYYDGYSKEEIKELKKLNNPLRNGKGLSGASENIKNAWAKFAEETKIQQEALKAEGGFFSKNGQAYALRQQKLKVINEWIPTGEKYTQLTKNTQNHYDRAKKLAEYATKNPEKAKRAFKLSEYNLAKANAMAHAEKLAKPATGFFGKIGRWTGIDFISGKLKQLATKSPITAKLLKHGKGNGIFLAIEGGMALFTEVIPAFHLGAGKGIKQIGKSAIKTGASVGGWIVGAAAGAKLGAALGLVGGPAGSVIGGVVGGLLGMVCGSIGSWLATKAVSPLTKSEVEISKEEEAEKLAKQAAQDPKKAEELMALAAQRLQSEGKESEDAKIAFGSLTKIAQAAEENKPHYANNETSFKGNSNPFAQQNYMDQDIMSMDAGLAA